MAAAATGIMAAEAPLPGARLPVTLEPHRNLFRYYLLTALLFGPGFVFAVVPLYFRFHTLRYDVDEEGITMRWGILFRREVSLTYARIQDIQLASNVVERWLGLARIQLQTASGSSSAEMTIEGIREVERLRDFLYSRMRGVTDTQPPARLAPATAAATGSPDAELAGGALPAGADGDDPAFALAMALDAVAAELRAVRGALADPDRRPR